MELGVPKQRRRIRKSLVVAVVGLRPRVADQVEEMVVMAALQDTLEKTGSADLRQAHHRNPQLQRIAVPQGTLEMVVITIAVLVIAHLRLHVR